MMWNRDLVYCPILKQWCHNGAYCVVEQYNKAGVIMAAAVCEEGFVVPIMDKENLLPFGARGIPRRDYE